MPLTLLAVRCLTDNYAYLLHDADSGRTVVVDAPEAAPIIDAMTSQGWTLSDIFLTHHHHDHVSGVEALRSTTGAAVWGARADAHRLPPLDHALSEGDIVTIGAERGSVVDVPGHTVGHIAFHFPESQMAFTGDSLMALGCGRLFEGTAAQMWDSLCKLSALPDATRICSGHDYLDANAAFALDVAGDTPRLAARVAGLDALRKTESPMAVVPLSEEKATNPFLRASDPALKTHLGMETAADVDVFANLRARKDRF